MKTSDRGRREVEGHEGFVPHAYKKRGDVWTIAFGHTRGVKEGDTCTREQGDAWLEQDLASAEAAVNFCVRVPLTQDQFDALVDFVFNEGGGALSKSTLLHYLNLGDYKNAALHFFEWNKEGDGDGHLVVGPELVQRRLDNAVRFYGSDPREEPPEAA